MEYKESEPLAKKVKLASAKNNRANSVSKDSKIGLENSTTETTRLPYCPSRDMQSPRAVLHDKYSRPLETGERYFDKLVLICCEPNFL